MVRRFLLQPVTKEGAQQERERGGAAAGDGAIAGQVFEEADHQHLEIDGGINAVAAALRGVGIGGAAEVAAFDIGGAQ